MLRIFSKDKLKFNIPTVKNLLPSFLVVYLFLKRYVPWLPGWSCPIRHATGIPCPTCFLTRSISASLNGNLGQALEYHVFGPPVAFSLVLWMVYSLRRKRKFPFRLNMINATIGLAVLFCYWLLRLGLNFFFGVPTFPG